MQPTLKIFSMTFLYILALSKQLIKHGIKITVEKELFPIILTSVMAVSIFWYFESMMSLTNLTLSAHIAIFSQCLEVFWNKNKPILKLMHFLFHLENTICNTRKDVKMSDTLFFWLHLMRILMPVCCNMVFAGPLIKPSISSSDKFVVYIIWY